MQRSECGLGSSWLRPACLSRFATARWFLVVYGLLGTTQAMAVMYFVATLTTLEKRFKIPSKTTGVMMTGNELSQILLALVLAYYGGRGNRPVWIAWGVALSALSCFMLALPHVFYGAGSDALSLTVEYGNATAGGVLGSLATPPLCNGTHGEAPACEAEYSVMPLVLVFLAQFVLGIGTTLYYALGQTYLDDNVPTTRTPLMLGAVLALRTIGPALGFLLGFASLSIYIEPSLTPTIGKRDPRWLGAWWLGWIIQGFIMLLLAVLIGMFPKQLPQAAARARARTNSFAKQTTKMIQMKSNTSVRSLQGSQFPEQEPLTKKHNIDDFIPDDPLPSSKEERELSPFNREVPDRRLSFADFTSSVKRMLRNKLLMLNIIASVFYVLGTSGYTSFVVKYLETQFLQPAAKSNATAGIIGILAMAAGFLSSGFIISKFQPRTVTILGWNVFVGSVYVLTEIVMIFIKCPGEMPQQVGSTCSNNCDCTGFKYTPLCHEPTNQVFYSACQAGCTSFIRNGTRNIYSNCQCLNGTDTVMVSGICQVDCSTTFIIFMVVMFSMQFIGSTGKVGNVLINYRCVDERDKPFAAALTLLLVSLLSFIPGPILFGSIIDSTCLEWDITCGKRGNCWLYDRDKFRVYVNSTAAVITLIGVVLDAGVCYLGRNVEFYASEDKEKKHSKLNT